MVKAINHFEDLPAMRAARARAVLQAIDRDGADEVDYAVLRLWFIHQPRESRWTEAQLEQAINDLAELGKVTVRPGRFAGVMVVERLGQGAA